MASIISAGTTSGTSLNLSGDTSGVLQLATNGSTTAITVDTSQNVGIGTASPQGKLDVSSGSAGVTAGDLVVDTANKTVYVGRQSSTGGDNSYLVVRGRLNGSGTNQAIVITGDTTAYGTGIFRPNNDNIGFSTLATERGRFTSGGYFKATNNGTYNNVSGSNHEFYNSANAETLIVRNANASFASEALIVSADRNTTNNSYYFLRLNVPGVANRLLIADSGSISTAGSVQLGDAGAPPTSGVGIKFPATQSASSDANTLDDYEEGTWTPSIGGTATYNDRYGRYIKIGRLVTIQFRVAILTRGTGSTYQLQGLPFTSENISSVQSGSCSYFESLAQNTYSLSLYVENNATTAQFVGQDALDGTCINGLTLWGAGAVVFGSATYLTNA